MKEIIKNYKKYFLYRKIFSNGRVNILISDILYDISIYLKRKNISTLPYVFLKISKIFYNSKEERIREIPNWIYE